MGLIALASMHAVETLTADTGSTFKRILKLSSHWKPIVSVWHLNVSYQKFPMNKVNEAPLRDPSVGMSAAYIVWSSDDNLLYS